MVKQTLNAFKLAIAAALLISMGSGEASSRVQSRAQSQTQLQAQMKSQTQSQAQSQMRSRIHRPARLQVRQQNRTQTRQSQSKTTRQRTNTRVKGVKADGDRVYYPVTSRITSRSSRSQYDSKKASDEKIVSASVSLAHSQSMIDQKDGRKKASRLAIAVISTKISSQWDLATRITYAQDLRDIEEPNGGFSDLIFILSKKSSELTDWLTGNPSYLLYLPTSLYSQRHQNLQSSVAAQYRLALSPSVLAKGFGLSLALRAARHFHQYETDVSGEVLNQYGLREAISGSYSYGNWTASADLTFSHAWNYRGRISQAFEHSQEIGYAITPMWNATLGHTNSGAWLRPNGQDSNFKLIDENDSIIYASTTVSF